MKIINTYWPIILFGLAAFSYVVGYINESFYIKIFKLNIMPTEVFSINTILISGITFIVLTFFPLVILFSLANFASRFRYQINNFILLYLISSVISIVIVKIMKLISLSGFNIIPEYLIINKTFVGDSETLLISVFMFSLILVFSYLIFINNYTNLFKIILLGFVGVWFSFIFVAQITNSSAVTAGTPTSNYTQVKGAISEIITVSPIHRTSRHYEFKSNEYYTTYGVLLDSHDNKYYFVPGVFASSDEITWIGDSALCVIEENQVITNNFMKSND